MTLELKRKQLANEIAFDVLVKSERIIKSSEKAFCILIDVEFVKANDFNQIKSVEIWIPKLVVKDNYIPKWFVANKMDELMQRFHIIHQIHEQGK